MALTKADVKAKRQAAMGVVGEGYQLAADMYDRVIAAGDRIKTAVASAEAAQMAEISSQVADLNEVADDLEEFGQVTPQTNVAVKVAAPPFVKSSDALAALQNAQPNPKAWNDGDAYHGTHPPEDPPKS